MTFKDLQNVINLQPDHNTGNPQLEKIKGKAFWYWDSVTHNEKSRIYKSDCCMQHYIGLPKKNGKMHPFYDYEKTIYMALLKPGYLNSTASHIPQIIHPFKEKHLWIKKSVGLGVSEFMLRFMAWLCLRNDDCRGSQMVIVTGPNIDLAIKLVKRMKGLFQDKLNVPFNSKETTLELNGCTIEAYPSNHIASFRSLTNPKFILIDESDYLVKSEEEEVRAVSERYIAKSDPWIVMVSTPNRPDGLFASIEKEPFDKCLYKKLFLDYTYGLGKIYSKSEIEKAKLSPSFVREYELQYIGFQGNIFSESSILNATNIEYNPDSINQHAKKSFGIDAGFGNSNYAIVGTQFVNNRIEVIFAEEYSRPNFVEMINRIWEIKQKCGYISNIYVDGANPEVWESLKREFDEPYDIQYVRDKFAYCKKYNLHIEDSMFIVPVPFSVEAIKMLAHAKWIMEETAEDGSSIIAIDKRFDKLLTGLRSAVANEFRLDKEISLFNDLTDAFRLALTFYKRSK